MSAFKLGITVQVRVVAAVLAWLLLLLLLLLPPLLLLLPLPLPLLPQSLLPNKHETKSCG
jgi:hypothetical protein